MKLFDRLSKYAEPQFENCEYCKNPFIPTRSNPLFCSKKCEKLHQDQLWEEAMNSQMSEPDSAEIEEPDTGFNGANGMRLTEWTELCVFLYLFFDENLAEYQELVIQELTDNFPSDFFRPKEEFNALLSLIVSKNFESFLNQLLLFYNSHKHANLMKYNLINKISKLYTKVLSNDTLNIAISFRLLHLCQKLRIELLPDDFDDDIFYSAVEVMLKDQEILTAIFKRKLDIGSDAAEKIIEKMKIIGIVTTNNYPDFNKIDFLSDRDEIEDAIAAYKSANHFIKLSKIKLYKNNK